MRPARRRCPQGRIFTFGGDYPGQNKDFNGALQFQQTRDCTSPMGGFAQYCSTILK